jgi:hypothetical protein
MDDIRRPPTKDRGDDWTTRELDDDEQENDSDWQEVCKVHDLPPDAVWLLQPEQRTKMRHAFQIALMTLRVGNLTGAEVAIEILLQCEPFCDIGWLQLLTIDPTTYRGFVDSNRESVEKYQPIEFLMHHLIPYTKVIQVVGDKVMCKASRHAENANRIQSIAQSGDEDADGDLRRVNKTKCEQLYIEQIKDMFHSISGTKNMKEMAEMKEKTHAAMELSNTLESPFHSIWLVFGESIGTDVDTSMIFLRQMEARRHLMKLIFASQVTSDDDSSITLCWSNKNFWDKLERMCGNLPICIIEVKDEFIDPEYRVNSGPTMGHHVNAGTFDRDSYATAMLYNHIDPELPFMYAVAALRLNVSGSEFILDACTEHFPELHKHYYKTKHHANETVLRGWLDYYYWSKSKIDVYTIQPVFFNDILGASILSNPDYDVLVADQDSYTSRDALDLIVEAISQHASSSQRSVFTFTKPPGSKWKTRHVTDALHRGVEYTGQQDAHPHSDELDLDSFEVPSNDTNLSHLRDVPQPRVQRDDNLSDPVYKRAAASFIDSLHHHGGSDDDSSDGKHEHHDTNQLDHPHTLHLIPVEVGRDNLHNSGQVVTYNQPNPIEFSAVLQNVKLLDIPARPWLLITEMIDKPIDLREVNSSQMTRQQQIRENLLVVPDFAEWERDYSLHICTVREQPYLNLYFHGWLLHVRRKAGMESMLEYPLIGMFMPRNIKANPDSGDAPIGINRLRLVAQHIHDVQTQEPDYGSDEAQFVIPDMSQPATAWCVCVDITTRRCHVMFLVIQPGTSSYIIDSIIRQAGDNWPSALAANEFARSYARDLQDIIDVQHSVHQHEARVALQSAASYNHNQGVNSDDEVELGAKTMQRLFSDESDEYNALMYRQLIAAPVTVPKPRFICATGSSQFKGDGVIGIESACPYGVLALGMASLSDFFHSSVTESERVRYFEQAIETTKSTYLRARGANDSHKSPMQIISHEPGTFPRLRAVDLSESEQKGELASLALYALPDIPFGAFCETGELYMRKPDQLHTIMKLVLEQFTKTNYLLGIVTGGYCFGVHCTPKQ